jgi:hypothetical protein
MDDHHTVPTPAFGFENLAALHILPVTSGACVSGIKGPHRQHQCAAGGSHREREDAEPAVQRLGVAERTSQAPVPLSAVSLEGGGVTFRYPVRASERAGLCRRGGVAPSRSEGCTTGQAGRKEGRREGAAHFLCHQDPLTNRTGFVPISYLQLVVQARRCALASRQCFSLLRHGLAFLW